MPGPLKAPWSCNKTLFRNRGKWYRLADWLVVGVLRHGKSDLFRDWVSAVDCLLTHILSSSEWSPKSRSFKPEFGQGPLLDCRHFWENLLTFKHRKISHKNWVFWLPFNNWKSWLDWVNVHIRGQVMQPLGPQSPHSHVWIGPSLPIRSYYVWVVWDQRCLRHLIQTSLLFLKSQWQFNQDHWLKQCKLVNVSHYLQIKYEQGIPTEWLFLCESEVAQSCPTLRPHGL